MKKDLSATKISILLYFIVLFVPLNYYVVKELFHEMRNDTAVMGELVFINGAVQALGMENDKNGRVLAIKQIQSSLEVVEQKLINFTPNKEYVLLFRADEMFSLLQKAYAGLEKSIESDSDIKIAADKVSSEINSFSKTAGEIASYKIDVALNKLFISLALTMIVIIALIFFVRTYMRLQFFKHTIHDHVTGLYNKKYFENVLENSKELAMRHNRELSLLILSIKNYDTLNKSLDKKEFESLLKEIATLFNHFFRHSDTVCRIEKNCFASITPDASSKNINKLSLRLQQEMQIKLFEYQNELHFSIGVATMNDEGLPSLLEEAKKNMKDFSMVNRGYKA